MQFTRRKESLAQIAGPLFLLKIDVEAERSRLLTYFSDHWKAWLFPFRRRKLGEGIPRRHHMSARNMEVFLRLPTGVVTVTSLGTAYALSVKPDPDYDRVVADVSGFCSVWVRRPPVSLKRRQFQRRGSRFRWSEVGDLRDDARTMRVNGDVVRAIHQEFATTLPQVRKPF